MKYIMLIYGDENAMSEKEMMHCVDESYQFAMKLRESGQYLDAAPLQHTSKTTTLRMRDGKRMVTDGPFAETHEQLGGYFLVDAKDLDEAVEIAAGIPGARWGHVEIRPLFQLPDFPKE